MQTNLWFKRIPISALLGLIIVMWLAYASLPITYQRVKMMINTPFIWGAISFIVLYYLRLRKSNNFAFIQTKDHENTHTFFVLLFFKNMKEMNVTSHEGGNIRYTGHNFGDTIIALAPYIIRIPLILSAIISSWVLSLQMMNKSAYFLLGFSFAYAYLTILSEAHIYQTDLQETNLLHSYLSIFFSHILMLGILSSLVLPNTSVLFFLKTVIKKALFLLH